MACIRWGLVVDESTSFLGGHTWVPLPAIRQPRRS
jgi:hypothetical protein